MYKRGMVVAVMEDTHVWGREETLPQFMVIKLPGVRASEVAHYLEPEMEPGPIIDKQPTEVFLRRRRWSIGVDKLPKAYTDELQKGKLEISTALPWVLLRDQIKNHETGATETKNLVIKAPLLAEL